MNVLNISTREWLFFGPCHSFRLKPSLIYLPLLIIKPLWSHLNEHRRGLRQKRDIVTVPVFCLSSLQSLWFIANEDEGSVDCLGGGRPYLPDAVASYLLFVFLLSVWERCCSAILLFLRTFSLKDRRFIQSSNRRETGGCVQRQPLAFQVYILAHGHNRRIIKLTKNTLTTSISHFWRLFLSKNQQQIDITSRVIAFS